MDHLNQKLTFTLTVTDNKGATSTDSVEILVAEDPSLEHIHINLAQPLSNIKPGDTFVIDGSKSKGNIISWSITQNEGPTVQLMDNPKRFSKQFIMPSARVGFTLTVKSITETQSASIIVNPDGVQPPPDNVDAKFPELLAKAKPGNVFVLDGSASSGNIVNWSITQTEGPTVSLIDNPKKCSKQFIMPNAKVSFTLNVNSPTKSDSDSITINPDNDQPTGDVLWDSNIHLKTGQAYKITSTYGDQKPDGKGVFMAASGNPRLLVDADGTFHLEADAGHGRVYIKARNYNARMEGELMFEDNKIRNTTLRLRSRHNMGGDCLNRFGGFGVTVEREEQLAETSTERCHNEHSNTVKKPLAKHIEVGKWLKFKYSCWSSADKKSINQKLEYDYNDGQGFKTVLNESFTNVEPHMMDEAKMMEESYAWLRVNNESTGKVAYRNVRIVKI